MINDSNSGNYDEDDQSVDSDEEHNSSNLRIGEMYSNSNYGQSQNDNMKSWYKEINDEYSYRNEDQTPQVPFQQYDESSQNDDDDDNDSGQRNNQSRIEENYENKYYEQCPKEKFNVNLQYDTAYDSMPSFSHHNQDMEVSRNDYNDSSNDMEENNDDENLNITTQYTSSKKPTFSKLSDENMSGMDYKEPSPSEEIPQHHKRKRNCDSPLSLNEEQTKRKKKSDKKDPVLGMMEKMGYKKGEGLGKNRQGLLHPIEPAKQLGRRGLGHHLPSLKKISLKWSPEDEEIKVKEDLIWLQNMQLEVPTAVDLKDWMKLGPAKKTIDDETMFCDAEVVESIVKSKSAFDELGKSDMRRARTRSNPFETIQGAFFQNRAAVKMANMDAICEFMFTQPKNLKNHELLYFADVCAGPGGFSEYVLWRRKWHAKGFGFTLKGDNDFKLDDFYAGPCETFHPYYGPRDDGNVYDPINQEAFRALIMQHTKNQGVHFMMADGGFSVEAQENIQEILSKQLYLCQCLVALMIVRTGGHFVTKLFDLFTPFSAGLVFLMYRCFDEITIFKPNTSRPANSERYLICKGKRCNIQDVIEYLKHANQILLEQKKNEDVVELVPLDELEQDSDFITYLRTSNNNLGKKQITGLLKIAAFCHDTTLIETQQELMRNKCLEFWQMPSESRKAPHYDNKLKDKFLSLIPSGIDASSLLASQPEKLTIENIGQSILNTPYNWFYTFSSAGDNCELQQHPTLFMGLGRHRVYYYAKERWEKVDRHKIELPPNTLILAELTDEHEREYKSQFRTHGLHILDAWLLGGEDVSQKHLCDRINLIKKFCEALWKPSPAEYIRVRAQEIHSLDSTIDRKFRTKVRYMKKNNKVLTYTIPRPRMEIIEHEELEELYSVVNQVLFLKSIASPWTRCYSKTHKCTYFFNFQTGKHCFDNERPVEAQAEFMDTYKNRIVWNWPYSTDLPMEQVIQLIKDKCPERNY